MGRFTDKLKALTRPKRRHVPAKQIDRWEGEGGALPPEDERPDEQATPTRPED